MIIDAIVLICYCMRSVLCKFVYHKCDFDGHDNYDHGDSVDVSF